MKLPPQMNHRILIVAALFLAFTVGPYDAAQAQEAKTVPAPEARKSPTAIAKTMLGDTYIKVVYSAPQRRGRQIFGDLVPFGEVWRTGANEATEITLTGDVKMGGKALKAGTYALFTIPNADKWTVIVNSVLGQWGSFEHDASRDVIRFDVPVTTTPEAYEAFTISFEEAGSGANLVMNWDKTRVSIPIKPAPRS